MLVRDVFQCAGHPLRVTKHSRCAAHEPSKMEGNIIANWLGRRLSHCGKFFNGPTMTEQIPQAVIEALGVYVYRLVDPRNDETFYVGKGQGERVLQHAWEALSNVIPADRLDRIRDIREAGQREKIIIHRHGLEENVALHVEAALIDAYSSLTNMVRGHGAELGTATLDALLDRYAAPEAQIAVPAIIIKIEQEWRSDLTAEQLYERVRRYWYCNPTGRTPPPTHAIAVARGLIREIYLIDRWEEYRGWPEDVDKTRLLLPEEPWTPGQVRRGFIGQIACDLAHLKRCSVRHLGQTGSHTKPP
jgi:hypothetical protein